MKFLSKIILLILLSLPCHAAIEFDGVDDYIDLGNNASLVSDEYTWSTWVKPNDLSIRRGVLMRGGAAGDPPYNNHLSINSNGSAYYVIELGPGNYEINSSIGDVTVGSWSHIVASFKKNARAKLFINGAYKEDVAIPNISPTQYNLFISNGSLYAPWGDYFAGSIDDTRIYNRELSNGEVLALYNSGSKRPSGTLANGLIAHYEMDDDEIGAVTAQAQDDSGNMNHGEFLGFDNIVSNGFSNDVPINIGRGTSLRFDGNNDYINLNNLGLANAFSKLSISLWLKASSLNDNEFYNFFSADDNSSGGDESVFSFYLIRKESITTMPVSFSGINIAFGVRTASQANRIRPVTIADQSNWVEYLPGQAISNNPASYSNGTWLHLVGTYNGSTTNLYINNSLEADCANQPDAVNRCLNGNLNSSAIARTIASNASGLFGNHDGNIDNIHVFNKELTTNEVSFLYNGSGLNPGTSNLQALWAFDDSALKDSSGNDNHGLGIGGDSLKYTEGGLRR